MANDHHLIELSHCHFLIQFLIFSLSYLFFTTLPIIAQTFNYTQTLDHFGFGNAAGDMTFQQRFVVDSTYWAGPEKHGPILVLLGGEAPIETSVHKIGIISKSAPRLRALILYIEHRFYGSSIPLGSIDLALQTPEVRSCLNSEQAMADYAEIILGLKANLSATESPVIVIGGSYAGMLAAWFRLKYPHVAIGALASSAPVFFSEKLPQQDEYCSIVSKDFQQVNKRCYNMIAQSWILIEQMGSHSNGLDLLKYKFNLCSDLNSLDELKQYFIDVYSFAAQYNGIDNYWINTICDAIVEAPDEDVLAGIANAVGVLHHNKSCYSLDSTGAKSVINVLDYNSQKAWNWQVCSEIIQHDDCTGDKQMFPQKTFDVAQYNSDCQFEYGVLPRPHWASTYYGGQDIKTSLQTFGSNIIFSNGLMDPLSGASVLNNISDTIVVVKTKEGSHCLDLISPRSGDPRWLVEQREKEFEIFKQWIRDYQNRSHISDQLDLGYAMQTLSSNAILVLVTMLCLVLYLVN